MQADKIVISSKAPRNYRKPATFSKRFKQAVKARSFRQLGNLLNDIAKDRFAPYIVLDTIGTRKLCWTMSDAQDWLNYAGASAVICETVDYSILAARVQK